MISICVSVCLPEMKVSILLVRSTDKLLSLHNHESQHEPMNVYRNLVVILSRYNIGLLSFKLLSFSINTQSVRIHGNNIHFSC